MGNGHESLFAGADGDCGGSVKMDDTLDVGAERVQGRMNGVPLGGKAGKYYLLHFTFCKPIQSRPLTIQNIFLRLKKKD